MVEWCNVLLIPLSCTEMGGTREVSAPAEQVHVFPCAGYGYRRLNCRCSKNFRANHQYLHPTAAAATPETAETAETAERPLRQSPALPIPLDKPGTTETALRKTTETATGHFAGGCCRRVPLPSSTPLFRPRLLFDIS